MAFDTKYRPLTYADVMGQGPSVSVLLQIVLSGTGYHQSYLFCGAHGSGKTTMGRILARALLCDTRPGGNPCDQCESCLAILADGTSECFVEFDAATNSGKDDIKKIIEELQYSTYSGKQRIYLFDEAHQLSKQALDALLKPMEDSVSGSEDKQLVCIFCTTEPEKMRATIFSRCAPAFTIRMCSPEQIADRLVYICEQEGIEADRDALILLAEFNESHIRDALKALEGASKLGKVDRENVSSYLRLDSNALAAKLLFNIGSDLTASIEAANQLYELISPAVVYKLLSETAMLAFRIRLNVGRAPSYCDVELLQQMGEHHEEYLLVIADHLSNRPTRPTVAMLICDIAHLHHGKLGTLPVMRAGVQTVAPVVAPPQKPVVAALPEAPASESSSPSEISASATPSPTLGKVSGDPHGDPPSPPPSQPPEAAPVYAASPQQTDNTGALLPLDTPLFRLVLRRRVQELEGARLGPTRRPYVGGSGTDQGG